MSQDNYGASSPDCGDSLDEIVSRARATVAPEPGYGLRADSRLTARQRLHTLTEPGTFVELGSLAVPITEELEAPSDGVVIGFGARKGGGGTIATVSYDFSVLGGSQGRRGHRKVVRLLELAQKHSWPVVIFAEGAGARAQELDMVFDLSSTFVELARLSGHVPLVCAVPGPSFAGHAALAGLCDVVIATQDATLGIAGPPLVEAALGVSMTPSEIGSARTHADAGTVDVIVRTEQELLAGILDYLRYLEPRDRTAAGPSASAQRIRELVPSTQNRAYDVRDVIRALVDSSGDLELRAAFAPNVVTSLARVGGMAVGVIANQAMVLGGAVDSAASDKITRFVHLCDSYGIPLLFLVDTPGFLVGPAAEESALVRHSARVIHALTHARVPSLTVILRKAYGLAYYALGASPFKPTITLAWPNASFGGMGLEGAATILTDTEGRGEADASHEARQVARDLQDRYSAQNAARTFAVDDLVHPEETRDILIRTLNALDTGVPRGSARRPIDPW